MKRKICVITGSRSDYGILKPLLDEIKNDDRLRLQLIVTGMHLAAEFGLTYKEIEKDGFSIDRKIKILCSSDTPVAIAEAIAVAIKGCAQALQGLKPDIVLAIGDRFEMFAAVAAAHVAAIPIGHIQGGEVTEGAFDDAFRHSITKMSYLHFTATEAYRNKVIQLGENPERVFNVGSLGVFNVQRLKPLSKDKLEKDLGFRFAKRNLLITFHPVTLEKNTSGKQFENLLDALNGLKDTMLVFTKTNADVYGRIINKMIGRYVLKNPQRAVAFSSLGTLRYLSMMRYADAVVGNSSSGIIEAPSVKIGTVNIGDRQKGRIKAASIIECEPTKEAIQRAFKKLYSRGFQEKLKSVINPYEGHDTAREITDILKRYELANISKKPFYDIPFDYRRPDHVGKRHIYL